MKIDLVGGIGLLFLLGGIALLTARCQIIPPDEPPRPVPIYDASPNVDHCIGACQTLTRLHCEWAEPTPGNDEVLGTDDDGTCLSVCRAAEESPETSLNPACVAAADSCDVAEACVF